MKVKFVPQNVEFEIKPGESVMHVAQDHGLYIKSVCKGVPSCAECRVRVVDGEHHVLPPGSEELSLIGTGHFIDHRRLSCQLKCFGDISVDMTEQIQKEQGLIGGRKSKNKTIKDDRVEDAHAIRVSDSPRSDDEEDARPAPPRREPRAPRPPRNPDTQQAKSANPQAEKQGDQRSASGAGGPGGPGGGSGSGSGGKRKRRRGRGPRQGGAGTGAGSGSPRPTNES